MFGYLIPKSYKEALEFDKENNNTKWADATRDEMDCIKEQQVFTKGPRAKWDPQHKKILNAPPNHQKLRVNFIFAVKYNGRHKARLVADGSLTPEPTENIYSGVVSLRHFVEKSVFSIWVDLLLCRSIQLLVLSYAEMFVYMYLSQLMSTFTNYLKVHHLLDGFFIP